MAIVGLGFRAAGAADIQENPIIHLAEMLTGKGYQVRIFDGNIDLTRLADANTSVVPTKPFSTTVEVALKQSRDMMTHGQTMRFGHVDTH